jgi:hypothetical protein
MTDPIADIIGDYRRSRPSSAIAWRIAVSTSRRTP